MWFPQYFTSGCLLHVSECFSVYGEGTAHSHCQCYTPFTWYNQLYNRFDPVVSCKQTSNRLSNRFNNRLDVCLHDTASCETALTTMLNEQPVFIQPVIKPGCTTSLTTSCLVSCIQPFNRLSNRFHNRLYRVNGALLTPINHANKWSKWKPCPNSAFHSFLHHRLLSCFHQLQSSFLITGLK